MYLASLKRSELLGLGTIILLVTIAAICMYAQRTRRVARAAPTTAATIARTELPRFRADAWQLPDEPLLGFVEIPAGAFLMGSDPNIDHMAYENERWSQEQRQGSVELPAYYIGRYEVTVAQFAAFAAATGHRLDPALLRDPSDHPAANVSWTDALAYARWLQATLEGWSGTPPLIRRLLDAHWCITLPSEAEWEKAARGSDGRIYPWGNTATTMSANFGASGTRPVGKPLCETCVFGLADMSGNVWEQTRSPYQPYPFDVSEGPRNPDAQALFIMRGGSFNDAANNVRAAVRGGIDPGARRAFIGFRLVLTPAMR